jgi:DNA (cytosine-5)-methyltransferase 1
VRYLDICSGISAPTVAWAPLGWTCAAYSEIEPFPRAVLAHHYPDTPLHCDFTTIGSDDYGPIDLLVGGTPCQSFSVAGLRGGLGDDRGNLALEYLRLADRKRPRWLVWENVPGVFSSLSHPAPDPCEPPPPVDLGCDGAEVETFDDYHSEEIHAFERFLAGLRQLGYGFAYRVLDAQHFGVPQRRRRVFVVGHLGDWRRAAAVLFERHGLQGHPPPRRRSGQNAPTIPSRSTGGGGLGTDFDCDGGLIASTGDTSHCLNAGGMGRQDYETETLIAHSLRGEGFDPSEDGTGRGTPLAMVNFHHMMGAKAGGAAVSEDTALTLGTRVGGGAIAFSITPSNSNKDYNAREVERSQALTAGGNRPSARGGDLVVGTLTSNGDAHSGFKDEHGLVPVAFAQNQRDEVRTMDVAGALAAEPGMKQQTYIAQSAVRRLTPRECERLQGFPDDFTLVPYRNKPASDGPRYKALGNSMAVPVVRWIGERIEMVEAIQQRKAAA